MMGLFDIMGLTAIFAAIGMLLVMAGYCAGYLRAEKFWTEESELARRDRERYGPL
jgi:hypothetical protein